MARAVIDKTILDSLINAKLASLADCTGVQALPVAWRQAVAGAGCNWHIPGWVGDARGVARCTERVAQYLSFLQAQFDIPAEG